MAKRVELITSYASDPWHVYGEWRIQLDSGLVEMAAVVGVRPSDIITARAAGLDGLVDVWFNDSSDWEGLTKEQRDEALDVLINASEDLMRQIEGR